MSGKSKPYTVYRVEGAVPKRRWRRVLLIVATCVLGAVLVGVGGAYIWLNVILGGSRETDPGILGALEETTTSAFISSSTGTTAETIPDPPNSMNIIVFGSDHQEEGEEYGRSDSIMVVHVDSANDFVSVLSLPRDLRVEIPGYGVDKLNAAYSYGGEELAIRTVQQLTNIDLDHFVTIDFDAFRQVTTELGGVWIDVDRRYYHQAQVGAADPWENIDIQAGYQRLMGEDALDFVRFRHDSNVDFGRMERQQLFLREAQRQLVGLGTAFKIPELVSLVASNIRTDLSTNQILSLAFFGLGLDGARIKSVKLDGAGDTIGGVDYVIYDDDQVRARVQEFLSPPQDEEIASSPDQTGVTGTGDGESTGGEGAGNRVDLAGIEVDVLNGSGRTGQAGAAAVMLRHRGAKVVSIGNADAGGGGTVVSYPVGWQQQAQAVVEVLDAGYVVEDATLARLRVVVGTDFWADLGKTSIPGTSGIIYEDEYFALQSQASFSLMGPGYIPEGYVYRDRRVYEIDAGNGKFYPAVKTVYQFGEEDQYLGIMQTTYAGASVVSEGEKVTESGITFTIVGISGKVDHIWWKQGNVVYWVTNTLMHRLSRDELLLVATNMIAVER